MDENTVRHRTHHTNMADDEITQSDETIHLIENSDVDDTKENSDTAREEKYLEDLTSDIRRLDKQEKEAKKTTNYQKNRVIFLIQSTLLGISYSIVWPTLWLYIKKDFNLHFTTVQFIYGLTFVAYPIASILSAFIVERTTLTTKNVILMLNGFEIIGNLLFSINVNASVPIIGRFIAGLGDAFYVVLMRDMRSKRGYTKNESMTIECLAAFIFGIIISPGINIITSIIPFKWGGWRMSTHNYPGLSISILFLIMEFVVFFFLPAKSDPEDADEPPIVGIKCDDKFSVIQEFHVWGYKAIFIAAYSFLYTYIVAFIEISIPMIIYERLKVTPKGAMLLYAVVGTLYAMILMFGMTVNIKHQLEASVGVSVLAKTIGMFGIIFLSYATLEVHKIIALGAMVIALTILWSNDDILFINLVRVLIPGYKRERTHNLRKNISKMAFGLAGLTVAFYLPSLVYMIMGTLLMFFVYVFFIIFVVVRCLGVSYNE